MLRTSTMSRDFQDTMVMEYPAHQEPAGPVDVPRQHLSFHGTGAQYFRIWIVNLVLSFLTLGIYSAWAKVRAQRFFYANTELDGTRFEYHAKPLNILIGRVLLLVIALPALVLLQTASALALLALLAGLLLLPWLIASSMRFKTSAVSWSGVRFSWQGSTGSVYLRALKVTVLTVITLRIYYFAGHHAFKRLLVDKLQFGPDRFECKSKAAPFFRPCFIAGTASTAVTKLLDYSTAHVNNATVDLALGVMAFGVLFVAYQWLNGVLSKIILDQTSLGDKLMFTSHMTNEGLFFMHLRNGLLILVTLGLYWPWAKVGAMQYLVNHFEIRGDLRQLKYRNIAPRKTAAFGHEAAQAMDFDVSF